MNKDIIDPIATENNFEEDDFGDFVATPTILPLEPIAPKSLLPGMDFHMQLFEIKAKFYMALDRQI